MTAYVGGGVSFWFTVFDDNDDNDLSLFIVELNKTARL